MENVLIRSDTMTDIANAIRKKTGKTDGMFPAEMPREIESIQTGGVDNALEKFLLGTIERVVVPDGVIDIKPYLFADFSKLVNVILPNEIKEIGTVSFTGCERLLLVKLPSNVISIGNYAFQNCKSITLTEIPKSVTNIGNSAFSRCIGLTTMTFKGTQITITSNAFSGCTNLTEINVPWSEDDVANAPWGATNATINYNYVLEDDAS